MRSVKSVAPPAGQGTHKVIGRCGKRALDCAIAMPKAGPKAQAVSALMSLRRGCMCGAVSSGSDGARRDAGAVALRVGHQGIGEAIEPCQLQAEQDVADEADHGRQQGDA